MYSVVLCALVLATLASAGVYPNFRSALDFKPLEQQKSVQKDWWETASFYQIYPRSFKDSNGDGVGDLNGITENLAYLKEIGIAATWLSPIFKSPMADFGYDIADFYTIDPIFGTMEDFDNLIAKANQVGIKIILDFVPNHSSDECEWFQKSIEKDPEYKDYYVWHPGRIVNGKREPPSNWISVFRGSAWTWNEKRGEYYLHQFAAKQPDLNYRNPKMREVMDDVLRFWLKKGVAGFRIDAVPHTFEVAPDADGNYSDEPRNPSDNDPESYGYLQHTLTVDQPETLEMVFGWRKVMDDFQAENGGDTRVILTECSSPLDVVMKYYGNATVNGAHIPFNFLLLSWITNDSDAYHYAETINAWLTNMPEGRTANWVLGNHDQNRVGSRLGADRIDLLNMLMMILPGCSVTYQGEEIGMLDVWISWNDTVDPQACNSNPSIYEKLSRDPERTPFQWNDLDMAGFTTGNKTWLPIADNYLDVNVKKERGIAKSHLNVYKKLIALRRENTLQAGDSLVKALSNNVVAIYRYLPNDYAYISLLNINDGVETLDLSAAYPNISSDVEYSVVTDHSPHRKGETVSSKRVLLLPKEAAIFKTTQKLSALQGDYYIYNTN